MLDVRFGLTMADILCGKVEELSEAAQAELKAPLLRRRIQSRFPAPIRK
jgi:hypothetical protein